MKNKKPMSAGIISTCLALVLVLLIFVAFAKVDLVYIKNDREICRQNNVTIFSTIEDPVENIPEGVLSEGEEISFTYVDGDKVVDFDRKSFDFKIAMAKLVVKNFISFEWTEENAVMELSAK